MFLVYGPSGHYCLSIPMIRLMFTAGKKHDHSSSSPPLHKTMRHCDSYADEAQFNGKSQPTAPVVSVRSTEQLTKEWTWSIKENRYDDGHSKRTAVYHY
ncbi:uncharacterized protein LOC144664028 [Oculina patagonica]